MSDDANSTVQSKKLHFMEVGDHSIAIDVEAPNWVALDPRGDELLRKLQTPTSRLALASQYRNGATHNAAKAWLDVDTFVQDAVRAGVVARSQADVPFYPGRESFLETTALRDFWLHINDQCNLRCSHCLVSSGPDRQVGLAPPVVRDVCRQARKLGAKNLFVTGGEPTLREDLPELLSWWLADEEAHAVVLTNGLTRGERWRKLCRLPRERLALQISLDGPTAETNDPVRGQGTFDKISAGIRRAVDAGFDVTVTAVVTSGNADVMGDMPRTVADLGARSLHMLWPHRRGRSTEDPAAFLPSVDRIIAAWRKARAAAAEVGIPLDNDEAWRLRLDGPPGTKHDLASAAWESLCLYTDGKIYPSAALAGVPELALGSAIEQPLEQVWRQSLVARELRSASVAKKTQCQSCEYRFLCGGGDLEHSYLHTRDFHGDDPYCALYKTIIYETLRDLTDQGTQRIGKRGGFDRPVVLRSMGERAVACGADAVAPPVRTSPSVCALSLDVEQRSRELVREFYTQAAEAPQEELCCPVQPDPADMSHVPKEVVDRFYGCGSPIGDAGLQQGETIVDLGSGAGIDVFIASKKVGASGQAIGVDMTDAMLQVARENQPKVAASLGWANTDFRKGTNESIPVDTQSADVIVSNCVINLSPDKSAVFGEMWRVLRDGGRFCVADIVSETELPPDLKVNAHLWGECLSGALSEQHFLAGLERAGFFGMEIAKKTFWRAVEGHRFYSLTVRGYKLEKQKSCAYTGQRAVYLGPLKAAIDEEGHFFPRGVEVEVCTDTAFKLRRPAYAGQFAVLEPEEGPLGYAGRDRDPDGNCC